VCRSVAAPADGGLRQQGLVIEDYQLSVYEVWQVREDLVYQGGELVELWETLSLIAQPFECLPGRPLRRSIFAR
jgi:hypothetical protein